MVAEHGSRPGSSSGVDLGGWAKQPGITSPPMMAADGMPNAGPPQVLGMQMPVPPGMDDDDDDVMPPAAAKAKGMMGLPKMQSPPMD